ncbi:MAG: hypothetical protein ACLTHL_03550 [Collinsella sp.]
MIAHIMAIFRRAWQMSTQKIDRVVTSRILGLPIFVSIVFCVYHRQFLGGCGDRLHHNDQLAVSAVGVVPTQGRDAYDESCVGRGDATFRSPTCGCSRSPPWCARRP